MKKIFAIVFFLNITCYTIYAQSNMLLIGPTLHYNIGGGVKNIVYGLEVSYWTMDFYSRNPAIGLDCGIEFEGSKTRLYTEFQSGVFFGASVGYVCQFGEQYECSGFQGSIWGAFYGGLELRLRRLNNTSYFAPGGILKFPLFKNEQHYSLFGDINFM